MVGAAFARDAATAAYYEQRAAEYDEWYLGKGRFAVRDRPGWDGEVAELVRLVRRLEPARALDIACGSGFLTRHLRGPVVGLDRSPAMALLTRSRIPTGGTLVGDALALPFPDGSFDRLFTGHFYGHLPTDERAAFLSEADRVAGELVVVDSASRTGAPAEEWQERVLNDGSRHRIYKRYLAPARLVAELGGEVVMAGTWFVAVRAALRP
ncbi:methyltransferase domain-containing protein [Blastococcus montanus]|uniref:class I SAM-dependent methyltransferase n=1 Tax=Blastococcus montanus TaxID=3144973 RepID=UPI00320A8F93